MRLRLTAHPNPPPQGGREHDALPPQSPSPLTGEGWGGGDLTANDFVLQESDACC